MINLSELRQLACEQQGRLMAALTMTAGREKGAGAGGFVNTLSQEVAALNRWIKAYDCGFADIQMWIRVTQSAGAVWLDWYDWYSRIYSRPNALLDGHSIDEWIAEQAS